MMRGMATLDDVIKAEDRLAEALDEYRRFKHDPANWNIRQEAGERHGMTKRVADLSPSFFHLDEAAKRKIQHAEDHLAAMQREWLKRILHDH